MTDRDVLVHTDLLTRGDADGAMRCVRGSDGSGEALLAVPAGGDAANGPGVGGQAEVDAGCVAAVHGDAKAYNRGCRCKRARLDANARRRERHFRYEAEGPQRVDATGTVRRLRALQVQGWSVARLESISGIHHRQIQDLLYNTHGFILRNTERIVSDLYEMLRDETGPSKKSSTMAMRRGWHPSEAWILTDIDNPSCRAYADDRLSFSTLKERALTAELLDILDQPGGLPVAWTAERGWHFLNTPDPFGGGIPMADDDPPLTVSLSA